MTEKENNQTYMYTYSSQEREEIDAIRQKYLPKTKQDGGQDTLSRLKQIEHRVETAGIVVSLIMGIMGSLILGVGMCCVLVWMGAWFIVGIPVGLLGIAMMMSAYPLYIGVTRRMRKKYADEVLSLSEPEE